MRKLLTTLLALFIASLSFGQSWTNVDPSYNPGGVALGIYTGDLVNQKGNAIVLWNGIKWNPLGGKCNGTINAYCIYNGNLIAGGSFDTIGSSKINNIAQWNGANWVSLGNGINGTVKALCVYNSQLIAGGSFDSASGTLTNNIAQWNGTNWDSLGTGIIDTGKSVSVNALCIYNSNLVIGGSFIKAGGIPANGLAQWNGISWDSLNSVVKSGTTLLCVYNGTLVEYDGLVLAGSVQSYFAQWNGTTWIDLYNSMAPLPGPDSGPIINGICVYNGNLIAGGNYNHIGGPSGPPWWPDCYVENWNGTSWNLIGTAGTAGLGGDFIYAVASYDTVLYANEQDGVQQYINTTLGINELTTNNKVEVFPNPSNGKFSIELGIRNYESEIEIYNILGEEIYKVNFKQTQSHNTIDISNQPPGIYLYRISSQNGELISSGKLIIQ